MEEGEQMIRVGVIGVGHLGRFHALNYKRLSDVSLIGVTDIDKRRCRKVAEEAGCESFDEVDQLLSRVEAVSLAVPTDRHFDLGKQILQNGVHCLIEKPIASNEEEASSLIDFAQKNNAVLHVGHIERFNPAMRAFSSEAMSPQFIESHRLAPFNPRGTEVAVILDLMIHDIDIILNLINSQVERIDANGVAVVSENIDIANARIRFMNGCVANLTASRISQKKMRKMRLFQKDTYISVDFLERETEIYRLQEQYDSSDHVLGEMGIGERKKYVIRHVPKSREGEALENELISFVQAVRGESSDGVTGIEGMNALVVARQILNEMEV
jgi:predicted dehydrogenase